MPDHPDLVRLGRLLADRQDRADLAEWSPPAAARLTEIARAHGVEAWLVQCVPDTDAWPTAADQRLRFAGDAVRAAHTVRSFAAIAEERATPWLVVKGPVVAEDLYPARQFRHSVDVDVLIEGSALESLLVALLDAGWQLLDRNWPLLAKTLPGQLRIVTPSGGLLDLHWNLLNNPRLRRDFPLPTRQMLDRRRFLASGVPALDPPDQLVHLGIHGAQSGGNRLVWLADVAFAAGRIQDWETVGRRARSARAGAALGLMLLRAAHWIGSPTPENALSAMGCSASWRRLCRALDRRDPIGLDPNRPGLSRSLARSARSGLISSSRELAGHGTAWFASGAHRSRPAPSAGRPEHDPLHEVDDAAARRSYLAAAAAG